MADEPNTYPRGAWKQLMELRAELSTKRDQASDADRWEVEDAMAVLDDTLLRCHAPTIPTVQEKLRLIWGGDLHGRDYDSNVKLGVLKDLDLLEASFKTADRPVDPAEVLGDNGA